MQSRHPGRNYLQNALDTFILQGRNSNHQRHVHEPILENTQELLCHNPSHWYTEYLSRVLICRLLSALEYLHTDAHLIHTGKSWLLISSNIGVSLVIDISAWNISLRIENTSIIQKFIEAKQEHPSPRKEVQRYTVYASKAFDSPSGKSIGELFLSDFRSAVSGDVEHKEDVQPNVYRAPEVCLEAT